VQKKFSARKNASQISKRDFTLKNSDAKTEDVENLYDFSELTSRVVPDPQSAGAGCFESVPNITLTLKEAADFLNMSPEALRRMAKAGEIPGAKIGKSWVFYLPDLVAYIRSRYASPWQAS
jgi:excisionase family DNA binding protein